ncbi:hypothetical protein KUTeg_021097 [Tegillarca granosa]|uniref:Uncharacterized protein n=1 Tax=Tegillarca granosa TaxID=220873 RepID=A0ABQ9EF26_TEGGR|nr:hypothetical protein KUTeg_021097 [Tegillarca granosa]
MKNMAAPMQKLSFCVLRINRQTFQRFSGQALLQRARTYSSDADGFANKNFKVGLSEDESIPLPRIEPEIREGKEKVSKAEDYKRSRRVIIVEIMDGVAPTVMAKV